MGTKAITETVAGKMNEIGDKIESGTERLKETTDSAALKLHYGADKVRSMDGENMVRQLLDRYPVGSLAAALFLGIAFGRALRR